MNRKRLLLFSLVLLLAIPTASYAQAWSGILNASRAIDWTTAGVPGGIPNRSTICVTAACLTATTAGPSVTLAQLNAALGSCPSGDVVLLAAGTYNINGTLSVPSNCTLRGAGTLQTILNATGTSGSVIRMGTTGPSASSSTNVTSGATIGSTSMVVASPSGITTGTYLMVTEINDPVYVTITTPNGTCTWCDGSMWSGTRVRGQIVEVTGVSGSTVTFSPALYSNYGVAMGTAPALATYFQASAKYAGVENLQVYANGTGYGQTFSMTACAYCWIKGVFDNYADGDHVDVYSGFHDEIRDNYFSNAYVHSPGSSDSDVSLLIKTSGTLVENNILERLHVGIMISWGAAGNVIAYNYSYGNFDASGARVILASIDFHGAHPQFNLFEGNVANNITMDSFWGSGSSNTIFRNQFRGTDTLASPMSAGRNVVNWSSTQLANEQLMGNQFAFPHTNINSVGNVLGSADAVTAAASGLYTGGPSPFSSTILPPASRSYNGEFYAVSVGYDTGSDSSGSGVASFVGGLLNAAGFWVGKASGSIFQHGNFDIASKSIIWNGSTTQTLPASFYRSSKPSWFGSVPWPAIGPDVTGGAVDSSTLGGHVNAIPAEVCYNNSARDANGLKIFDPNVCYSGTTSSGPPTSTPPAPPTGITVTVN
jgi:hypothetical protein